MTEPTLTQVTNVLYGLCDKWKELEEIQRKLSNTRDDASWCMADTYSDCRDDVLKLNSMILAATSRITFTSDIPTP